MFVSSFVVQGEVELESESSWIINGIISLQRRLHVAESELAQRYAACYTSSVRGVFGVGICFNYTSYNFCASRICILLLLIVSFFQFARLADAMY